MYRDYRINIKYFIILLTVEMIVSYFNMRHIANFKGEEIFKVATVFYTDVGYNSHRYFFVIIIPAFVLLINYTLKADLNVVVRGQRILQFRINNYSSFMLSVFFALSNAITTFILITVMFSFNYYNLVLLGFVVLNAIVYSLVLCCFAQLYFILKNFLKHDIFLTLITIAISLTLYFGFFKKISISVLYIYRSLYITRSYFELMLNQDYVFYLGGVLSDIAIALLVLTILKYVNKKTRFNYELL